MARRRSRWAGEDSGLEVVQKPLRPLMVPEGKPLVGMEGKITVELVRKWATATRAAYARRGFLISRQGLQYLLDFWFIDPLEHPRASAAGSKVLEEF